MGKGGSEMKYIVLAGLIFAPAGSSECQYHLWKLIKEKAPLPGQAWWF